MPTENSIKQVLVVGLGLIGGSLAKAAIKAGHSVEGIDPRAPALPWCHSSCDPELVAAADLILLALPPNVVVDWISQHEADFKSGCIVVDATGVKGDICRQLEPYAFQDRWTFIGGHPMAGREVSGFENSSSDLFINASMILTPYPTCGRRQLDLLDAFFRSLGFARLVITTPSHHDEMIALTSQLAHVVSSAYVQDPLAPEHHGYSAGSFHDMTRVARLDPDIWTNLFLANHDALLVHLDGLISRLSTFRTALATRDSTALHDFLATGRIQRLAAENAK